jgi:aspartyl-tRNA(Asn)/glutamyl-tRNA(Gln) amidotransferase subunit A
MARTVADCLLFENVIAGPHPNDVVSLRPKLEIPERLEGIEGWKIGLAVAPGDYPVDPDVVGNTVVAAEVFREAGATVEEVEVGWRRADVTRATLVHFGAIFGASIDAHVAEHGHLMTPYAIDLAERSRAALEETTFYDGLELEAAIYGELGRLFERFDVFVCPPVLSRGFVAGDDYVDHGLEVGGADLEYYFEAITTPVFNIASRCPVLVVPSGLGDNGVPTGIQIVGRTYDDVSVFRAAAAYERLRPGLEWPVSIAS